MFEKVQAFLAEKTEKPVEEITLESQLTELGVDSMELMMIVLDFESEFDVEISDRMLENLHTVSDLVELVDKQ